MKAMVLAAGYGVRLRPITDKLPKALIRVGGRPMIEYSLLLLRHYGIRDIVINLHHLGDQIEAYLKDGTQLGLRIDYARERTLLDTGGGLLNARRFFSGERFIVINSDIIIDLDLEQLVADHRRSKASGTLVVRQDPAADFYGPIEASADRRIRTFLGHRAPGSEDSGPFTKYMFTGLQVLEPKIFGYMESGEPHCPPGFSITKATYPEMLRRGEALFAYPFEGFWQDLGTPERLAEAESKLGGGEVKLRYLEKAPSRNR